MHTLEAEIRRAWLARLEGDPAVSKEHLAALRAVLAETDGVVSRKTLLQLLAAPEAAK